MTASFNGNPAALAIAYATGSQRTDSKAWDQRGRGDYVLIRREPGASEYRVNRVGAPEATAAYESDLESAKGTARAQAQWWSQATGREFSVKFRSRIVWENKDGSKGSSCRDLRVAPDLLVTLVATEESLANMSASIDGTIGDDLEQMRVDLSRAITKAKGI